MLLVGGADGTPTPFDGKYLAEYDPGRDGRSPWGGHLAAHIAVTDDPSQAKRYAGVFEMWEDWKLVDPREPVRRDGQPNRPLTYFSVISENVPDD